MKKIYKVLFAILLVQFSCQYLFSQTDTLRVQTFTWDSNTRSEIFQFPDEPGQSFRKIWMKYNMRCHDAAVGNGNVGCREWDYSCNTFITDPSRTDSTRQTHPTHVISNFQGSVFDYTTQQTWSYLSFDQHQSSLNVSNPVEAHIGNGGEMINWPGNQSVAKTQFLYRSDELANAGLTAGFVYALDLQTLSGGDLHFLRIRMKNTNQTELDAGFPDLDGWKQVYFSNTVILPNTIQRFPFYEPFEWDGNSNILVEFSFTQIPSAQMPGVMASEAGFTSSIASTEPDFFLEFNGAGAASVPGGAFGTVMNEITISCWTYGFPESMPSNSTIFEGKNANNQRQVNVHLPWGNGQVYWDCGNDGSGYDRINKQANPEDYEGKWNHWAFTKNATTGDMRIYLNGNLWHSGSGLHKTMNITEFEIGSAVTGTTSHFGKVDEFRIWNKALDEQQIRDWMRRSLTPDHPDFDHLVVYYQANDGTGTTLTDQSGNGQDANLILPVGWTMTRGKDLFKNFISSSIRPDLTFLQGDIDLQDSTITVVDSFPGSPHSVVFYGLNGTDLVATDTQFLYQAGFQYVINEFGETVDSVWVQAENSLAIGTLSHFTKSPAKYELLSLVTPYGNGLDLGDLGKTFTFDVTDFAPILKGEKRISIEMGGEWQEELDIEFLFITGTPAREVLDIQHIWPFRRGWYAEIQNDRFFEPRTVALSQNGHHFKLRSAITGHGQNGEFVPRSHYLNILGGTPEFNYQVWKECADNPIYPQGGTWIFDRSGWCPGAATDVHEFDITDQVSPGETIEIDYGVNGAFMDQANYLVTNQLVTYGPYTHTLDASLERIARPNGTDVEFERINPACSNPVILVRNTGAGIITSLTIEYFVQGNTDDLQVHQWGGQIEPDQLIEIELPVLHTGFWDTPQTEPIFEARIIAVNGITDGEPENNRAVSSFKPAHRLDPDFEYVLETRTNNIGSDNSYKIRNAGGEVIMERANMQNNTTYEDEMDFPPGCYTLEFLDASDDGLQFWFFPNNGSGRVRISKVINIFLLAEVTFNSDFGRGVRFDFVVDEPVSDQEEKSFKAVSTFPNPASDQFQLELRGFEGEKVKIELYNVQGNLILSIPETPIPAAEWQQTLSMEDLPAGSYFCKIVSENKVYVKQVMKQ